MNRQLAQLFTKVMEKSVDAVLEAEELTPAVRQEVKNIILSQGGKAETIFKEAINNAATQGGKRAVGQLKENGVNVSFSKFNSKTQKILDEKAFEASKTTMDKVTGRVMDSLKNSYEQGHGIDKAAQHLKTEFTDLSNHGLKRIARTEINSAQNQGSHLTMKQLGVEYKQWWNAQDDRVRGDGPHDVADHISLHGQIIRVGDTFENGLLYPGDMSGEIEEWIECRCTEAPFIPPLGMTGPDMPYFYEEDLVPVESESNESQT